jgi:hypothetical protein
MASIFDELAEFEARLAPGGGFNYRRPALKHCRTGDY